MSTEASGGDGHEVDTVECSILVPVLNEERYIEQSVAAMRRQRFGGGLEFLFADGGSSDRTREILDEIARVDSRIRVFANPRRDQSSGLNVALSNARGRWIARMDAHTEYPDDYVSLGISRLSVGGTAWVSGPQVPKGDNAVSRAVALALASPLGRGGSRKWATAAGNSGDEFELDAGVFAGVWERSTLLAYGGWDEHSSPNEDSEMAGRFLADGERLVCLPGMGASYVPRGSLRGLWRQYRRYGEYRARTAALHPHTLRRSHLLAPALVLDTALAVVGPRGARAVARAGLGTYAGAIVSTALVSSRQEGRAEALIVGIVLPIMHYAHGAGFLRGVARFGPPLAALASMASLTDLAAAWAPDAAPLFNPSLSPR